jgi:Site-specific recombinase XerD
MSVKLRKKKNKSGSTSLYLDIYHNGRRDYEFLTMRLAKPATSTDREANRETLELAKKIALKRAQELAANDYNLTSDNGRHTVITDWMQAYVDKYRKRDKRNMQGVLNRFKAFLIEEKKSALTFGQITETIVSDFQDYLRANSEGEGAASYFNRFKKMMKQAKRDKIILSNPAEDVKTKGGKPKKKDTLLIEEIQTLAQTPIESDQVKRAALFSCVTGFAWIDVKKLKWSHINLQAGTVVKMREKNDGEVDAVHVNLNDAAKKVVGQPGKPDEYVFDLPTANGCNKTLKAWVKRAGIQKKITWHNLRHSFGTNLIFLGEDITTASELLGHTSLKHTQRYVRAANEMKQRATDKLNINL